MANPFPKTHRQAIPPHARSDDVTPTPTLTEIDVFLDWWEEHGNATREDLARELRLFMPAVPDPLLLFCDDSSRYAIRHPWTKNGVRYATDSRIMVAIDVPGESDSDIPVKSGVRLKYPKVEELLQSVPQPVEWMPLAEAMKNSLAADNFPCPFCMGYGRMQWYERVVNSSECVVCDGEGHVAYTERVGEYGLIHTLAQVGDSQFSLHYLERMKLYAPEAECGVTAQDSLRFRFDGGVGILMAVTPTPRARGLQRA